MKVTMEGERIVELLGEVISARGFESDTFFEMAKRDIGGLPKLEGTVHVNLALVLKFMANYLFNPAEYEPVPVRRDAADDEFLFRQGPTRGLGKIRFHDWRPAYDAFADVPQRRGASASRPRACARCSTSAPPSAEQLEDLDFLLALAELFTLIPYGQLILEQAQLGEVEPDILDQVFDVLIRDFSTHAIELHGKDSSTDAQQAMGARRTSASPLADAERSARVYAEVRALAGAL